MLSSDFQVHLDQSRYNALWGSDSDSEGFAFGEDDAALERIIEEELGPPRRRKRSGKGSSR